MRNLLFTLLLLFSVLWYHCSSDRSASVRPAFYHWQTQFVVDSTAAQYLHELNAQRVYVKFFDIDWDFSTHTAVPLAILDYTPTRKANVEIVPTLFITNRVFREIPAQHIDALKDKAITKIVEIISQYGISEPPEIQIDCDWTQGTQEPYFLFLTLMRKDLQKRGITLSATIRLHQVKFAETTGVPPVDRGMLMYYNMGEISSWEENNSILNNQAAQKYLPALSDYPLPLDLALPLFSWGLVFREGKMVRIINLLNEEQLADRSRFYPLGAGRYEVIQHTFLDGTFLYEQDVIRLEDVQQAALDEAVGLLKGYPWPHPMYLSFYHLDSAVLQQHPPESLRQIITTFQN
jgi:hypothetical protein